MSAINYDKVHSALNKHMLAAGMPIVWNIDESTGSWLVDGVSGKRYLDLFSFFATNPIGHNHPKIVSGPVRDEISNIALQNPSNSDVYTREMAEFVDTFMNVTVPEPFKYIFLIAGGTLAVENALKAAFDWKVQKNFAKGIRRETGHQVIHFRQAFHGRSGYTLSMTNTLEDKIRHFPKFSWPRITNPKITFPLGEHLKEVIALENQAVEEIRDAFRTNKDDIAAIIIEPIQCEGGDNHFRTEFFRELRTLADENEAMLIFDEIQTGFGMTGTWWLHEQTGVVPDMVAFGKKTQVCGFYAGPRIDEVEKNVFKVPSRINSTWGGNLVDMVRSKHYIRIIDEEKMLDNVREQGEYLLTRLHELQNEFPNHVSNARGRGLLCSFTVPGGELRDSLIEKLREKGVLILGAGPDSIRFRPSLNIERKELNFGLEKIGEVLREMVG